MRGSAIVSAIVLSMLVSTFSRAASVEGRVDATRATVELPRQSSYSNSQSDLQANAPNEVRSHGAEKMAASAVAKVATESQRPAFAAHADKASWFRLYDAGRTLLRDRDGDGHHSEFQIRFDADVISGNALVYARLYLRRVGDAGAWRHYYTTQDFWIYGQSGVDDYFVTTSLDAGFPAGRYDVLIDLYEVGYTGIVATLAAYDDTSLADLPLEERGLDIPIGMPGFGIGAVTTTLLTDNDNDGFYSRYRVAFDPISSVGVNLVYAELWVRPSGGEWLREHRSENFWVDASGTSDRYTVTGELVSGYNTARYDAQIDLFDAATGLLIASAGSERPELSRVPLEDQSRDRYVNAPSGGHGHDDSYSEEGGGGIATWFALLLSALLWARIARRSAQFGKRLR